jgi:integrase
VRTRDGIEQRSKGVWRVTVAAGRHPGTGKYIRVRETVQGTRTDAKKRRDELRVEVARGTYVRTDDSVTDYLQSWVTKNEQLGHIRPKVAYTYAGYVRREVLPRIGRLRLEAVRPPHVQRIVDDMLEAGKSARTATQVHRILHAAFRDAVRLGVLRFNPCDGVKLPRLSMPKLRVPDANDVGRLVSAMESRYRVALAVIAGTGMRRGEALALTWSGVEMDDGRPHARIEGTLQRSPAGLVVERPKTERSARDVPLSGSLVALLRDHRRDQVERQLLAGTDWHALGFVFDRGNGEPVDPDTFSKIFRNARANAGLEGVRLHDLRHAFASILVNADTNARVVSDLLGHSDVAFTLRTYFHPDPRAAAEAVSRAEEILGWGESGENRSGL